MNRRTFQVGALAATFGTALATARAQAWPERPVKLILSLPAGSGVDAMARMIGEQLGRRWNQPVVVENRPGGQNAIGAQAAAKSPPDGYTFYFTTAAALVTNAYLFKSLSYDPRKDFVPVGMVGKVPFVLAVGPASRHQSLQDLVAFAKSHPGKLDVANEGPKTFGGMMTRLLASQLGTTVNSVAYVAIGAALTDVVGGQVEAILCDVPSAIQQIRGGKLRPLAVTTARRVAGLEGVPPLADVVPGFDFAGWVGIVAPAGTPAAAIQRFNRDLEVVLAEKDMPARLLAIGPVTEGAGTPEQMAAFLRQEHERWTVVTKAIGVLPE